MVVDNIYDNRYPAKEEKIFFSGKEIFAVVVDNIYYSIYPAKEEKIFCSGKEIFSAEGLRCWRLSE